MPEDLDIDLSDLIDRRFGDHHHVGETVRVLFVYETIGFSHIGKTRSLDFFQFIVGREGRVGNLPRMIFQIHGSDNQRDKGDKGNGSDCYRDYYLKKRCSVFLDRYFPDVTIFACDLCRQRVYEQ